MDNSTPQLPLGPKSGKGKKSKSSVYFAPVNLNFGTDCETISYIEMITKEVTDEFKIIIDEFLNSNSTDDQIYIMKKLIDKSKNNAQENVINFIVIVLFESEQRHPVKCLLMRHLNRWTDIHEIFINLLSRHIMSYCHSNKEYDYERSNFIVSRLGTCLENFPLGFQAVKIIESDVLQWLIHSLIGSLDKLKTETSPEEKLNTSKLMHQTLRLLLQIFQKASVNMDLNESIKNVTVKVIDSQDVSVDNKCLCAMLDVAVLKCEGTHPWDKFEEHPQSNEKLWSANDTNQLCFYYALFSSSPSNLIDLLDNQYSAEAQLMFHDIVQKIVDITDGLSGSVDATMAGARTVAIIASRLATVGDMRSNETKSTLNEPELKKLRLNEQESSDSESYLLGFNEINERESNDIELHEHRSSDLGSDELRSNDPISQESKDPIPQESKEAMPQESKEAMPQESQDKMSRETSLRVALLVERSLTSLSGHVAAAPRQIAAQAQVDLLNYYLQHHPEEGTRWLSCGGLGPEGLCRLQRVAEAGRRRGGGAALRAVVSPAQILPALVETHTMLQASSLLSTYIALDCENLSASLVYSRWVQPTLALLVSRRELGHDTLDHLVALLATAVDQDEDLLLDYILPLIKRPEAIDPANMKCTLLLMHVVLKSKAGKKYHDTEDMWKGIIVFHMLGQAILHEDDQVVSMSLSAGLLSGVSGGLKTLWCLLKAHAHRPVATHTRTLDRIEQFLKRVETEYRTAKRKDPNTEDDKGENYIELLSRLRRLCFEHLLPGGNHYRRGIALFVLKHVHSLDLEYQWLWAQNQVDTILRHIDDTYDTNRHTAFDILLMCPLHLLKDSMESSSLTSIPQIVSTCGPRARDASGAALRVELLLFISGALPDKQLETGATDRQQEGEKTGATDRQQEGEKTGATDRLQGEGKTGATDRQQEGIIDKQLDREETSEKTETEDRQLTANQFDLKETSGALDRPLNTEHSLTQAKTSKTLDIQQVAEETGALTRQIVAEKCLELAQSGPGRASALHILQSQLKHLPLSSNIWCLAEELAVKVLDLAAPLVEAASPEGYVPDVFFDIPVRPHPESKYLFNVGDEVMTSQTMLLYAWTSAKEAWSILSEIGVRVPGLHRLLLPLCERLLRVRHRALLDYATTAYSTLLQHYYTNRQGDARESEEINTAFDEIDQIIKQEILSSEDSTRRGAGLTSLVVSVAGTSEAGCHRMSLYVIEGIRTKAPTAPHIAAALLRAKKLHRNIHHELQHFMLAAFEQLDDTNTQMQWSCTSVISAGVRRTFGPSGPGGGAGPSLRTTVFVARYPILYKRITEIISKACEPTYRTRASLASALLVLGRVQGEGSPAPLWAGPGGRPAPLWAGPGGRPAPLWAGPGGRPAPLWAGLRGAAGSPAHHVRRLAAQAAAATLPQNKYLEHTNEILSEISDRKIEKNLCHGLILRLMAMVEAGPELQWCEILSQRLPETLWIMETECYSLVHEYINLAVLLHTKYREALTQDYCTALGSACAALAGGGAGAGPGRAGAGPGRPACGGAAVGAAHALAANILDAGLRSDTYEVCLAALNCYLSTVNVVNPSQLCALYTSHPHPECRRLALQVSVRRGLVGDIVEEPPSNLTKSDVHNWKILKLYEKWENAVENERGLFVQAISQILTMTRESETQSESSGDETTEAEEVTLGENSEAEEITMGERAGRAVATVMFASSALTAAQDERDAADEFVQEHANWLLDVCDDEDLFIPMCIFGAYARQVEGRGRVNGRDALVRRAAHVPALLLALALLDFAVPVQEPDETSQYRAFERSWDPEIAEEGLWTAQAAALLALPPALGALGAHRPALGHVCGDNLAHFVQLIQEPTSEVKDVNPKVVYLVSKLREIVFRVP